MDPVDSDPGGQKLPTKIGKSYKFHIFKVLDVLFLRAEFLSCSLDVRYGGQGISKLQFLKEKKIVFHV